MFRLKLNSMIGIATLGVLLLLSGCEQLVEQLSSFAVVVENPVLSDEEAISSTEDSQVIDIVHGGEIRKGSPDKLGSGFLMVPVDIPPVSSILNLLEDGGLEFSGTVVNEKDKNTVFYIYFANTGGLTDPMTQGALMASLAVPALATVSIQGFDDFEETELAIRERLYNFFSANPGLEILYVYLTGTPKPVEISVLSLSMILRPSYHLEQTIYPDDDYLQYADQVEDVTGVELEGQVTNHGQSEVELQIYVWPEEIPADWTGGCIAEFLIPAKETVSLQDWSEYLVPGGRVRLERAIEALIDQGQAIRGEIFCRSETKIHVMIKSLIFKGHIKVKL